MLNKNKKRIEVLEGRVAARDAIIHDTIAFLELSIGINPTREVLMRRIIALKRHLDITMAELEKLKNDDMDRISITRTEV